MARLTFSQCKTAVGRVLNLCADGTSDTQLLDYVNRACERLLYKAHYPDTYARYRVCVNQACITWPRELETIEAAIIDESPAIVRNQWYEFLDSGPGGLDEDSVIGLQLVDRGNSVAFDNVTGTGKRIAVYCDGAEDTTLRILLRYVNSYGNKQFTALSGVVIEGESIALPAAGNYSYTTFDVEAGGLYHVVKPVTNYMVRIYEYDTATGALRPLAYYEPQETVPTYRNSLIPSLSSMVNDDCDDITLIVMGKKRFIPAASDDDMLMIPNLEAIRLGCQAIRNEESNLIQEAAGLWTLALGCLEDQGRHWNGSGSEQPMKVQHSAIAGPSVYNLV